MDFLTPKSSKDIIGNKFQIKYFTNLLKHPIPKIIGLIGPYGCGKSLICSLVLKELHLDKSVILIDNVENMPDIDISNINTSIVITSRTSLISFKENIEIINLNYPPIKDVFIYLTTVLPDDDEEYLLNIVKRQKGNMREIISEVNLSLSLSLNNMNLTCIRSDLIDEITRISLTKSEDILVISKRIIQTVEDDDDVIALKYLLKLLNINDIIKYNYERDKMIVSLKRQFDHEIIDMPIDSILDIEVPLGLLYLTILNLSVSK